MRRARKVDGSFLFDSSEYLTAKQIGGFFSRLAIKRRAAQVGESKVEGEVEEDELEAQVEEEGIETLVRNIIDEIGVIHPIMFDTYDLSGADLGFFKRQSKILGSDRCDVIVMTSPIR